MSVFEDSLYSEGVTLKASGPIANPTACKQKLGGGVLSCKPYNSAISQPRISNTKQTPTLRVADSCFPDLGRRESRLAIACIAGNKSALLMMVVAVFPSGLYSAVSVCKPPAQDPV